jgi:hypothetical protein
MNILLAGKKRLTQAIGNLLKFTMSTPPFDFFVGAGTCYDDVAFRRCRNAVAPDTFVVDSIPGIGLMIPAVERVIGQRAGLMCPIESAGRTVAINAQPWPTA